MAEKRVSVRLAAVGGKQVKAELNGIGDAGKRGFGKASREMEIANARLAHFARRAKIATIQDAIHKYIPAAQRAAVALQIFGARARLNFTQTTALLSGVAHLFATFRSGADTTERAN